MTSNQEFHSTGLKGLDRVIQGVRRGDNLVMQVGAMSSFTALAVPFTEQAFADGREVVYFRFASQQPPLLDDPRVQVEQMRPEDGFEPFILALMDIAESKPPGTHFVFDCLTELAADWYSDQMLGNFIMIVCPFFHEREGIVYHAVMRNQHMQRTVETIMRTAQVILEVYRYHDELYVQPLKAMNRFSPTLFMLHRQQGEEFIPVTSSATVTEIMANLPQSWLEFSLHRPGVWRRTVIRAQEVLADHKAGKATDEEADACCLQLLRMAVTRDERYLELCRRFFNLEDIIRILGRMIGSGLIGGKALGMLLSRTMLVRTRRDWTDKIEAHDSFFIGSDVFYTYLVQNGCWWSRRIKHDPDYVFNNLEVGQRCLLYGDFPQYLVNQFREMLNYFGQSPIIVRSSSLLEDNYGNAFSGKYESVFCPNQGPLSERLEAFTDAVRKIYASALSHDALVYRKHRGLLDKEEQMALLVQRVSGTIHGRYFFPDAAGVGYSYNPFVWDDDIDPKAGFLRLVCGLGTRAVDRLEDDYTRLVALNAPHKRIHSTNDQMRQYSQRHMDVLDLEENLKTTVSFEKVAGTSPESFPLDKVATRDQDLLRRAQEHGLKDVFAWVLTFDKLLGKTPFTGLIREMMQVLQSHYDNPVDIEFTLNFTGGDDFRINVLQCRPFQVRSTLGRHLAGPPADLAPENRLITTRGPVIGQSRLISLTRLIYVVPSVYARLTNSQRFALARVVGKLNMMNEQREHQIMIIGPGRWGTTTPSFGVPVTFQEIRWVNVICEMAVMHEGLIPDVSLGTHFFNDLVELDMLYLAVFPDRDGYGVNEARLRQLPNRLAELLPNAAQWTDALLVVDAAAFGKGVCLHADSIQQSATCFIE